MDGSLENGGRKEKRGWWERRSTCQRNLIVGVVTGGILAGLIIPLCLNSNTASEKHKIEDTEIENGISVIIIGSGPSGIAAAARLLESNITNVKILEAEERIGGRIQTVPFGDGVVDLGAQWCHGEQNNIVYEIASKLNLLENDPYDKTAYYHSSQKYLDKGFIQQVVDISNNIYNEHKHDSELTLGEYILQRFNTTIGENYGSNAKKIELAHEILNVWRLDILSDAGSFSWFDVSARNDYVRSAGRNYLGWKGKGYKTILDVLVKKHPDPSEELPVYESVILNKEVVRVVSDSDQPYVECADNTTYTADHIIWTPSLGVLKHRFDYLFEPELSNHKAHAIETLGIAGVIKVFFYFPQKWWPKHVAKFIFVWSKRDAQNVWKEFPYGPKMQGKSWLVAVESLSINRYNPNVLNAWILGEPVPAIEKLEDDLIINGTMFLLHKFLGHKFHNITRPQKMIREKWYSNDHFRGTYSYDTIEAHADGISQRDVLSEPVKSPDGKPVLLFAGEATSPTHFGTVHGAIESGYREADRLINYYREN